MHRYWRATGLASYGGAEIELSEFWLMDGVTRVDGPAALTSDVAPLAGTLANLRDNNTVSSAALARGTVLTWDFGAPTAVTHIRVGSALSSGRFLASVVLEWSDDGVVWTAHDFYVGIAWPGVRGLTTTDLRNGWGALEFMTRDPVDPRVAVSSATAHSAKGSLWNASGVRQFEIVRAMPTTTATTGVWRSSEGASNLATDGWVIRTDAGTKASLGSAFTSYPTGGWSATDVFGAVVDFTDGTMTVYKNGVSLGVAFNNLGGEVVVPYLHHPNSVETATLRTENFDYPIAGADPWSTPAVKTTGLVSTPTPSVVPPATDAPARYDTVATPGAIPALHNFLFDRNARGRIVGTVRRKDTPDNVPLARRVRLYRDVDGMFIAETWSNAAGDYVFENIEENEAYTAIAYDYQHNYRAIAADNLTLANGSVELMR